LYIKSILNNCRKNDVISFPENFFALELGLELAEIRLNTFWPNVHSGNCTISRWYKNLETKDYVETINLNLKRLYLLLEKKQTNKLNYSLSKALL